MSDGGSGSFSGGEPVTPYRRLDTSKRRRAGVVYLVMAAFAASLVIVSGVDAMWITAVVLLVILGAYQFAAGWTLRVTDMEAIETAAGATSFGFGHASATLGFHGLLAKPVWQVLVFQDGPTPGYQALVTVDGLSRDVTGIYEEAVTIP